MPPTILIVSSDKDFHPVLAEHLRQQLGADIRQQGSITDNKQELDGVDLMICDQQTAPSGCQLPVVQVPSKPLRLQDLLAQVDAIVHKASSPPSLLLGSDCVLDERLRQLRHLPSGRTGDITDKEMQLLLALADAGPEGLTREALLKNIWGFDPAVDTHTLETHIYRLRSKLKDVSGREGMIEAVEGGYRMTGNE